ncbi:MAG: tRNA pseudouridine(54/55) synthase Pus10 [Candidatus Heimdallarchaeota archaeon]|nr:tRNA pseudouridine(54/55) synthase Pus10 [Candidatus Heimdallarchaeota archaeon]
MAKPAKSLDEFNMSQLKDEYQFISLEDEDNCRSCKGITGKCIILHSKLERRLNQVEFETYLVGIRIHKKFNFLDDVFTHQNLIVIPYKQFMTNFYSDKITNQLHKTNLQDLPDVTIIIDVKERPRFNLDIRSLYILGKYQKLKRGVPQTKWPCSECKGRKCETCNYTGQQYPFTVETIVAESFLEASKSLSSSFHGAGREDIDALMLGEGRPFVLELKQPLIRSIEIKMLQAVVNQSDKVQITNLTFTDKSKVVLLKNSSPDSRKEYRATIQLSQKLDSESLTNLKQIGEDPIILQQQTPVRVSHRRADKIREKSIYGFKIIESNDDQNSITLLIEAEGGAYIKEFISGDEGRTTPSITEYLQQSAVCIALDVIKVDDKGLFNLANP